MTRRREQYAKLTPVRLSCAAQKATIQRGCALASAMPETDGFYAGFCVALHRRTGAGSADRDDRNQRVEQQREEEPRRICAGSAGSSARATSWKGHDFAELSRCGHRLADPGTRVGH